MALDAVEHLVGGLGTALLAVAALTWLVLVGLTCLIGVGVPLARGVPRVMRSVADRERARLSRWGPEIVGPGPAPAKLGAAVADPMVRRELFWVLGHGTAGLLFSAVGASLALHSVQDVTYPLWWRMLPAEQSAPTGVFWDVRDDSDALAVSALGLGLAAIFLVVGPWMARLQAWPGRLLLSPAATDLPLRVAELTATRAAALDAHATELRRIERSLHDGTQNRLVAVTVMLGASRRALARDSAGVEALLERTQYAAEAALAELRAVVRGILPPVVTDRGLAAALDGLAADCQVPCQVQVDVPVRCPASVEATAYYVAAEALTNIARHSRARHAGVTVRRRGDRLLLRVEDDGIGGVNENEGSGIAGIRSRVKALDGRLVLTSPPGGPTVVEVDLPCGS